MSARELWSMAATFLTAPAAGSETELSARLLSGRPSTTNWNFPLF